MNSAHICLILLCFLVQASVILDSSEVVLEFCLLPDYVFPEICLIYDKIGKCFVGMVSLVATMVFIYSYNYINGHVLEGKFYLLLGIFSLSMVFLSLSSNVFWMIVGWDGLGFSSFCLIVFYQNWKAVSGGLVTFLSNRFGDLFIICGISCIFLIDWCDNPIEISILYVIILSLGSMSKSAQVPFSAWLPMAMAAPTPVSSLVHSSTLVTAGVFVLSRFQAIIDNEAMKFIYFISSMTILVAGSSALFEWDLNKVVALSTLSHIGLIVNIISLGSLYPALWHMQLHAFFNSLLFIGAGVVIHYSEEWQDLRRVSWAKGSLDWFLVVIAVLSMSGIPFLAGFYSKELIMLTAGGLVSMIMSLPFWMGVMFTIAYSVRVLIHVLGNSSCLGSLNGVYSPSILVSGGSFSAFGGVIMWINMDLYLEITHYNSLSSTLLLLLASLGTLVGVASVLNQEFLYNSILPGLFWKSDSYVYFITKEFFKGSWSCLYVCDTKGVLDALVTGLACWLHAGLKTVLASLVLFSRIIVIILIFLFVILLIYLV